MGINKSPINMLLSLLFCAFFLFLLYDVGFNGGVYTLMVVNIAKRYFNQFVALIQRFGDNFSEFRFIP